MDTMELIEDTHANCDVVSLSSTSSDPLAYRFGVRSGSSCCSSRCGSDSDLEDDDAEGGMKAVLPTRSRPFHALETVDVPEKKEVIPSILQAQDVSEAPVAVIESVILSSATLVAVKNVDALILDIGTELCLSDGTLLGPIATVFGPVTNCSYAVVCDSSRLAEIALLDKVTEGTAVHYNLRKQTVLFDPISQCDSTRGTDASFLQDDELPRTARPDFSDDEDEREWKKRSRKTEKVVDVVVSSDESEVEFDSEGRVVNYVPRQKRRVDR